MWWDILKADWHDLSRLSHGTSNMVLRRLLNMQNPRYPYRDLKKDLKAVLEFIRTSSSPDSINDTRILTNLLLQISLRPENFLPPVVNKILERGGRIWLNHDAPDLKDGEYRMENQHIFFKYGGTDYYMYDISTLLAIEIMKQFKIKPESDISKANHKHKIDYILKADWRTLSRLSTRTNKMVMGILLDTNSQNIKEELKSILQAVRTSSSPNSISDSKILSNILLQISLRPENFMPPVINKIIERGGVVYMSSSYEATHKDGEYAKADYPHLQSVPRLEFAYGGIYYIGYNLSRLLLIEIMKQFKIKPESDITKASQKRRIDYDLFHNAVFSIIDTNEVILDSSIIHSIIEAYIKEVKNTGTHTYFINKFLKTTNMSSLQPVIQYISSVLRKAGYKSLGKGKYGRF